MILYDITYMIRDDIWNDIWDGEMFSAKSGIKSVRSFRFDVKRPWSAYQVRPHLDCSLLGCFHLGCFHLSLSSVPFWVFLLYAALFWGPKEQSQSTVFGMWTASAERSHCSGESSSGQKRPPWNRLIKATSESDSRDLQTTPETWKRFLKETALKALLTF